MSKTVDSGGRARIVFNPVDELIVKRLYALKIHKTCIARFFGISPSIVDRFIKHNDIKQHNIIIESVNEFYKTLRDKLNELSVNED